MDKFSSKSAFIITAVGSAVGLGNIFRFPGLAAEYGIWFILAYLVLLFTFGLPLLLLELYFGKKQVSGGTVTFGRAKNFFPLIRTGSRINCLLVLTCYLVFFALVIKRAAVSLLPSETSASDPLFLLLAVILAIISCGSADKLTKLSRLGVVFSVAVMSFLALLGLLKNSAAFSGFFAVSPRVMLGGDFFEAVFGQVFFSLSLGVGVMIAYGSMLPPGTPLLKSAVAVCLSDFTVSLVATAVYICLSGSQGTTAESLNFFSKQLTVFFGEKIGRLVGLFFFTGIALLCLDSVISYIKALAIYGKNEEKASVFITLLCGGAGLFLLFDNYSALGFIDGNILPLIGLAVGGAQAIAFSFGLPKKGGRRATVYFRFLLPFIFLFLFLRKIFT